MNWPNRILFGVNVVFALIAIYAFSKYGLAPKPTGWEWPDLVIILLVAISVVLAALTIFLAVLAIWGYTQIRGDAREQAEKTAKEEVPEIARSEARRQTQTWLASMQPQTDDLTDALSGGDDDSDAGKDS